MSARLGPETRPQPFRLRPARRGDLPALTQLFRQHLEYHAALDPRYTPGSDAQLSSFLSSHLDYPESVILVAETAAGLQGYLVAQMRKGSRPPTWWSRLWLRLRPGQELFRSEPVGYIIDCFVRAESRRQGLGRALVGEAVAWCRRQGAVEMELGVLPANEVGRQFWEQMGFRPCRIEMRREL